MNLEKWNALPASYRAILEAACAEANALCVAKYDHGNPDALLRLVASRGGAAALPAGGDAGGLQGGARRSMASSPPKNPAFKTFYDSWLPYWKKEQLWFRVAELPFDAFNAQMAQQMR